MAEPSYNMDSGTSKASTKLENFRECSLRIPIQESGPNFSGKQIILYSCSHAPDLTNPIVWWPIVIIVFFGKIKNIHA